MSKQTTEAQNGPAPSPGPVEAKRRPGLHEPWRDAQLVRWEGQRAFVLFKGEREEVEAYRVRAPKARKAKAPPARTKAAAPVLGSYFDEDFRRAPAEPIGEPVRVSMGQPRAVAKPARPARSRVYMDWIKGFPCLNCEAPANVVGVDPHHQRLSPEDLAVGRKVGDFFCVPLCRTCHDHYEDKNTLPRRTEFESLELMRDAQIRFLALALSKVPAVALRAALRGEVSDAA